MTPFTTIFQLYRGGQFYCWKKPGVFRENHRPAARHSQTVSHNRVSSTPHHDRSKYENEMSQNNVKTLLVYYATFNRSSVMSWRFYWWRKPSTTSN